MDKETRTRIQRATQGARALLEHEYAEQLGGIFDILPDGTTAPEAGNHLDTGQRVLRAKIVAAVEHHRQGGLKPDAAVATYTREAAFTTLNRFVALKMLEARGLVQECVSRGDQSAGFKEFVGLAPGLVQVPDHGYRLYIESIFDEIGREVRVLFDRHNPNGILWPCRQALADLVAVLNSPDLSTVWEQDETIGWFYQYFNGEDERRKMREESQAPRNSRELAVRNQFFTPRYIVQFLTDNTLGRIWYEMRDTRTVLAEKCEYMVHRPGEEFALRAKKDPRDLRVLDPACGSGHFLLYAFELLLAIYEEAHADPESPKSEATRNRLAEDYPSLDALRRAIPGLVLAHNLHGVDIDPRCAQIAQLALWMRAQKAYRDYGVARAERAPIRRSNIVVAEPLVAEAQIAKEFVAKLGDAELGRVFTTLVEALSLAGDLGLLLRVDQLVTRQAKSGQTDDLFAPSEERIRAALAQFVSDGSGATNTRRRFFVDDAAQGLGLFAIAERKFDAVVMNPPFGDPSVAGRDEIDALYSTSKQDLACCFLTRGVELTVPGGLVGALTSRTIYFLPTSAQWRRDLLGKNGGLRAFADLGLGVLDSAMVETAAIVACAQAPLGPACFFDATEGSGSSDLLSALSAPTIRDTDELLHLPLATLCYWALPEVLTLVRRWPPLSESADVRQGLATTNDFRTVRLWFEVPQRSGNWPAYAKGGEYQPFVSPPMFVVRWFNAGAEIKALVTRDPTTKHWSRRVAASQYYGRKGLTWTERTSWLSLVPLQEGAIFGVTGKGFFLANDDEQRLCAAAGVIGSGVFQYIIRLFMGRTEAEPKFQAGDLQRIPCAQELFDSVDIASAQRRCIEAHRRMFELDERTVWFRGPFLTGGSGGLAEAHSALCEQIEQINASVARDVLEIDSRVAAAAGLDAGSLGQINARIPRRRSRVAVPMIEAHAMSVVSWAVGVAFGRFREDGPVAGDGPTIDPFACSTCRSPAMAGGVGRDVLVVDEGHDADLVGRALLVLDRVFGSSASAIRELDDALGMSLREWLAAEYFERHLGDYSLGGRKAPIYWQLATPSASYSVWLYIHAFSKDTLFRMQNDYVAPKLAHEERQLTNLVQGAEGSPSPGQRQEIAAQESFVEELRAMLAEVKRVAPLWDSNLDDGVIINFAPLWRLVPQHRAWQKECKGCWDKLVAGDYDWAHLAMHLWPERVVPKCADDRSVAIAQGLEDVFWLEDSDGKWQKRDVDSATVARLVAERTSSAVKDALRSLLEAPASSAGRGRSRRAALPRRAAATEASR
jgi:hypothetical protein